LRCLNLDFGRTAIMALLDDLKGHGARQDSKIQANREQESAYPASAGQNPILCKYLSHSVFLAL
ncbi:MAG: hypothetical protein OEM30_08650, partial [Gammaproteobacteria bacterium]|nr:hypothetical protein [Gammaproteobacteria bacterium]